MKVAARLSFTDTDTGNFSFPSVQSVKSVVSNTEFRLICLTQAPPAHEGRLRS
jgi:hypothetical protein